MMTSLAENKTLEIDMNLDFHKLVLAKVESIIKKLPNIYDDATKFISESQVIDELTELGSKSEHHYWLMVIVLHKLKTSIEHQNRKIGFLFSGIIEQVQKNIEKEFGDSVTPFTEAINTADCSDIHVNIQTIVTKIEHSGRVSAGDVLKLYSMYNDISIDRLPSIDFLRRPQLIEIILEDVFEIEKKPNYMNEKFWLLALISDGIQSDAQSLDTVASSAKIFNVFRETLTTISPATDLKDDFLTLMTGIDHPITCIALINWIGKLIQDPGFYESNITLSETPPVFDLLTEIAIRRPLQRPAVLKVFGDNLTKAYPGYSVLVALRFKMQFLSHIVILMRLGYFIPVCEFMTEQTKCIDDTLLIEFLTLVFETFDIKSVGTKCIFALLNVMNTIPFRREGLTEDFVRNSKGFLEYAKSIEFKLPSESVEKLNDMISNIFER